jgi:aryl carrier-like protein
MIPAAWVWLDELPLTASGKIDRRALPPVEVSREYLDETYVAPQNETERIIASIWQEVLRIRQVGTHDNFFDLGGDSLRVYEVHTKLRSRLNSKLTILDLFRHTTITALANHLLRKGEEAAAMPQQQERAEKRKMAAARRQQEGARRGRANG